MTKPFVIKNDPSGQLCIPGILPYFDKFFKESCGYFLAGSDQTFFGTCRKPAALMGVYFRMAIEAGHGRILGGGAESLGDDSEEVYACSTSCLASHNRQIRKTQELPSLPEIIVNAHGKIEEAIFHVLDYGRHPDYFDAKVYATQAGTQESLREFWARESWRKISD
jgi:hypothetical protein